RVAPREVIAVVKADAYGHGAAEVARRLAAEGARRFAVAHTAEGVALRRAGVAGEVLLLSHAEPTELAAQRAYGLTPAIYDLAQAETLAAAAAASGGPVAVHVELDTGMGRAGVRPDEAGALASLLARSPSLRVAGVFANLSAADDPSSPETERQIAGLRDGVAMLRAAGVSTGIVHVANSAAVLETPDAWCDAVRPGLALYGIAPSPSAQTPLTPAMTVETRIVSVRRVPAGTPLGYGGRFVASRPTTVAVLPFGYHDGFRRGFSGKVSILLRGRAAPVVGAVSMDVTLVDATDCGAERGDRAICLGSDGGVSVTAWDLARAAGTIPYEILCGIGPRVRRVYRGGSEA
ncbi:MAG TPA: alanine racemase, partial [Thermoanaerobaculia bacterium]|nr:alanine racemase [Thermoanaerobaculia bacterium]